MHGVFCLEFCVWDTVTRSSREFLVITFSPQSKVYLFSKTYWFIDIRKLLMIKLLQIQSNLLKVIYCVLTHLFFNVHYHNGSFRSCSVKLNSSHMNCFGIGKPWVDILQCKRTQHNPNIYLILWLKFQNVFKIIVVTIYN